MTLPPLTFNAWLRYELIRDLFDRLDGVESVLEVGAGEGAMGARLARRVSYVGVEMDARSFATARQRIEEPRLGKVIHGDLSTLDPDATFDMVCAFEVLEHIEDDAGALRQWRERLRPNGWLALSVPAYQHRFGPGDRKAGHFRRYDPDHMGRLLESTGFAEPDIRMYGFPLGYALEVGRNTIVRLSSPKGSKGELTAGSGRWLQPPERLGWATEIVTAPFRWLQRPFVRTRMGTGLVVLARRA